LALPDPALSVVLALGLLGLAAVIEPSAAEPDRANPTPPPSGKVAVMEYIVADVESGNIVGGYYSEEAALEDVLATIEAVGEARIDSLSLACDSGFIAMGKDLVALARRRGGQRKSA